MATFKEHYDYAIIGGGVAAAKAVEGIRTHDTQGSIAIFGTEPDEPLYRPDLSKTLWLEEDASLADSALGTGDAEFHATTTVRSLEPQDHRLSLQDGTVVRYGAALLATGAEPRQVGLEPGPRVIYYRTAQDYRTLHDIARRGNHVLVVGGGYIGSEIAAALTQNDVAVTMVIDAELIQEGMFPRGLASAITQDFENRGVSIVHGRMQSGHAADEQVSITLADGTELNGDAVVIGVGVTPRTELAQRAAIETEQASGAVVVDDYLRTSAPDVYAAGDIASYPDARLGRRRVEHVDAAETMGQTAGENMAGAKTRFEHTPFFWSDLFESGYEAIGDVTSSLSMVQDWQDDSFETGVVYYLDNGRVRGVLLWNVWESVPQAEQLLSESAKTPLQDPDSLKGRIPLS